MRIVGGRHRGRRLVAPDGRDTRPTTDRTRESLFNILTHADWAPDIEGAVVLDAFCGTGALGLEALSRGAARCSFLDSGRAALDAVRANVAALGEAEVATVLRADATRPPAGQPCALAFLDPPYAKGLAPVALAALSRAGWLANGALAVVEVGEGDPMPAPDGFTLLDERRYGDTRILFLTHAVRG
ncbi:16S rRNA (guanine(966)-N(2))-methyltransferase RsmD [Azospirillum agricola]|uniref:16S rRNA (guanine(966)-N(2))-methyltransferase RsmD n=1 Tax=Azospirillum agricola TaxID=1720247 RepID=UPI000A0F1A1F|nr:16S rRNA (guanine(966)-N(2))-methyltransferase RsmD [Azospirillum agricola]SMH59308.1 16S rRNA (guanine966-N2)-methyltransferase [Azospirillum lipoferum]